jgi:membrane protease YdiL (CAAX protease family)
MVTEAKAKTRFGQRNIPPAVDLIVEISLFILIFIVSTILLETIAFTILTVPLLFYNDSFLGEIQSSLQNGQSVLDLDTATEITAQVMATPEATAIMLLATIGSIVGVTIYSRAIEGRKLATLGFRRGHILREYLVGWAIGAVMFSLVVLIAVLAGTITFEGLTGASAFMLLLFLIGYTVQGMSEEVLCRGYFLTSLARRQHLAVAIVVSSAFFGLLHLPNPNVSALAIINITLFGVFEGIYLLKRGNIWGVAAIHTAWNFTQGSLYGTNVSGMGLHPSLLAFRPITGGELINGGAFGLEAGLAASLVIGLAIVAALLLKCVEPTPDIQPTQDLTSALIIVPGENPLPQRPILWTPAPMSALPPPSSTWSPPPPQWPPPS